MEDFLEFHVATLLNELLNETEFVVLTRYINLGRQAHEELHYRVKVIGLSIRCCVKAKIRKGENA